MKLLLVEDDPETVDVFEETLSPLGIEVCAARSKAAAEAGLIDDIELVVCDLKIPSKDGLLDSAVEHGLSILATLRAHWSGVPVLAFSAHGTTPGLLREMLALGGDGDFLGTGQATPLLSFFDKAQLSECLAEVRRIKGESDHLGAIEVSRGLSDVDLRPEHKRAVRIAARRRGAKVARISRLGGGLSDAIVLRVQLDGAGGEQLARIVAKVGPSSAIKAERSRYQQLIAGTLDVGVCPGITDVVLSGAGQAACLLYELAGNYPSTAFDLLVDDAAAARVVVRLREQTAPWRTAPSGDLRIADIRRSAIDDGTLSRVTDDTLHEAIAAIEELVIQARVCTQHGDLHGLNVLVSDSGDPILIDFGEAARKSAAFDPVTLEMSPLFHPDSPIRSSNWPSLEQARSWHNLDRYVEDCPIPEYIRACRSWSVDPATTAGDREVAAVVLSYAARQLKYAGTDRNLASAFIAGAIGVLVG